MGWTGHAARTGERRGTYHVSVGESETKRPLASTRSRWEYDIKLNLQEMGWIHELDLIRIATETGDGLL
jgi:hypothetical protein